MLADSTKEKNYILLLDIYSKRIKNGLVQVNYLLEKYGRLKNVIKGDVGYSYTNMYKPIRNLLSHKYYNYLDIKNCQPTVIYNLCIKYGIVCVQLRDYIDKRDDYFNMYENTTGKTKKEIKSLFISLFYGKKTLNEIKNELFRGKKIDEWIEKLLKELLSILDFKRIN